MTKKVQKNSGAKRWTIERAMKMVLDELVDVRRELIEEMRDMKKELKSDIAAVDFKLSNKIDGVDQRLSRQIRDLSFKVDQNQIALMTNTNDLDRRVTRLERASV